MHTFQLVVFYNFKAALELDTLTHDTTTPQFSNKKIYCL
jgi:hypothetical protein